MNQTTLDILEDLESQLIGFQNRAVYNGDTDIAQMIAKFKQKTLQQQYNIKAQLEAAE